VIEKEFGANVTSEYIFKLFIMFKKIKNLEFSIKGEGILNELNNIIYFSNLNNLKI
jgi:hypothetical protein